MAPAENPAVVILVVMDEPTGGARDGGQVSAPVFREIAEQILPEMNVAPDADFVQENLIAENIPSEIPSEIEKIESPMTEESDEQPDDLLKKESKRLIEKRVVSENVKEIKRVEKEVRLETKKENKLPVEDKKSVKNKPAIVIPETKNKSSTEKNKLSAEKVKKKT